VELVSETPVSLKSVCLAPPEDEQVMLETFRGQFPNKVNKNVRNAAGFTIQTPIGVGFQKFCIGCFKFPSFCFHILRYYVRARTVLFENKSLKDCSSVCLSICLSLSFSLCLSHCLRGSTDFSKCRTNYLLTLVVGEESMALYKTITDW
jgi:hypothetical protein